MSRSRSVAARWWLLALFVLASPELLGVSVPYLTGRVTDEANLLEPAAEARIVEQLRALEEATGAQVAVLTVTDLEGENVEDFALRVAETWQLGREGVDDGALLVISRDDRQLRLEVGYGLEPAIPDLLARRILDEVIVPRFRQGDFAGGIENGVDVVAGLVRGEEALPPPTRRRGVSGEDPFSFGILSLVIFLSVTWSSLAQRGVAPWIFYLFLLPVSYFAPRAFLGASSAWWVVLAWGLGFPILWLLVHKTAAGRRLLERRGQARQRGRGGWWSSGGGHSGGGFSGGGFSGGGFSGGGGSFGGGGASSSW